MNNGKNIHSVMVSRDGMDVLFHKKLRIETFCTSIRRKLFHVTEKTYQYSFPVHLQRSFLLHLGHLNMDCPCIINCHPLGPYN